MFVLAVRHPSGDFQIIERETGFILYQYSLPMFLIEQKVAADGHFLFLVASDYDPVRGQHREGFFWPGGNGVVGPPFDWYVGLLHAGDIRVRPHERKAMLRAEWDGHTWINELVAKDPLSEQAYTFLFSLASRYKGLAVPPALSEQEYNSLFSLNDKSDADCFYRPRATIIANREAYERQRAANRETPPYRVGTQEQGEADVYDYGESRSGRNR